MVAGVGQAMVVQVEKKDDNRKSNKPIMERRRRARINNCLNKLKGIILDVMKKDPASHPKLEKADILEMTVKHLGGVRSGPDRYRAGYRRCLTEVARFPGLETELRKKLVRHLEGLVPVLRPPVAPTPPSDVEDATVPSSILMSAGPGSEVHLVPTRLSNGDMALLFPANVSPTLVARPTLRTFGEVLNLMPSPAEPFSPASSWGSPSPVNLAPLALVSKTLEGKVWRPW